MLLRAALPYALALAGLLKAGAVVWAGIALELNWWVVTAAAAVWAIAPPAAGWLWSRRRQDRSARAEAAVAVR